jgi:arylsulfatase A-like enzyme/Tfp pilus assembly protein PilF
VSFLCAPLCALCLCGAVAVVATASARGPLAARPASVLLITVDTLRADALGTYGNARAATPVMDRLAAAGVRFDFAHAHNVVTLPSHANILSGRHPIEHGVRDNAGFRFPRTAETLATLLKARGYRTGAFVSAFPLASRFGLARGFDVYDDAFVDRRTRPAFLEQERPATETVALARRWLDAAGRTPSFCWVHVYEPHAPYEPPEPFASRFRDDPYAGEVAAADAALAPLLEPILSAGTRGATLVVLTADHGESRGEHGEATHGIFAYEATLRVPLVVYAPGLLAPRAVASSARHVDILPTVLDALGFSTPAGVSGKSLLAAAGGRTVPSETTYFEALSGSLNRGWAPVFGVIRDGWKYVDLPIPELYDLTADPREDHDLAAREPARLESMRARLAPFRAADGGPRPSAEDVDTRERLRSLGYTGAGGGKARYGPEDDPKRLIALDAILQDVAALHEKGDIPAALARCRELVARRPEMPLSLLYLAQLERETGQLAAAAESLRKALALHPNDATTAALLGSVLTEDGRAREAVALLEPYAGREPADVEVLSVNALALARVGRTADALARLQTAEEADPGNAMVLVHEGTVHLMAHDEGKAGAAFEAALARNPGLARAHASLGAMAADAGRVDEAVDRWKRAIALDPREREKPLALGTLLWRRGRRGEARVYLQLFLDAAEPRADAAAIERVRGLLADTR